MSPRVTRRMARARKRKAKDMAQDQTPQKDVHEKPTRK